MRDVYAFMAIVLVAMALKGLFSSVKRAGSSSSSSGGAVLVMPEEDGGRHAEIRRGAMQAARDLRDLPPPEFTTAKRLSELNSKLVVIFGGERPADVPSSTEVFDAGKNVATDDYSAGYLAAISPVVASLPLAKLSS